MSRDPIPTWFFVLVVVRKGDRFLLVQESKLGEPWYLPAGRVESGESFVEAAKRETLEEAGIPIEVEGIIRLEHTPSEWETRVRVIFSASPVDDTAPKSEPDEESLGAGWFTLEEMEGLNLRGEEVLRIFRHVESDAEVMPLTFLGREGEGP